MPYPNEHSCRLVDPDKVDVVGSDERRHDGKAYRVIYGKPKDGDGSVEQAYRYPVDSWSESEARAHCKAHDGRFEPARSSGVELRFWAAVHSIETGEEERLATFYLMNTSLNRNNWRVTDKALEDAYPGLLGKPLGCIPGYRVNHVHQPLDVGKWVRVEKPDGYALATAEITDETAWERLTNGEWGPVSVVIRAFRVTCSVCGEDVTGAPDEHITSGEGHEVIESFTFERVDFVDEPAYPQAGIITVGHTAGPGVTYTSRSNLDGAQGPQGNLKPDEKEEKRMEELAELKQELEQVKAEKDTLKTENDELKGRVEALEDERHQERVEAAVEARVKAGLVADRQVEAERLKELDDVTLDLLREDAEKVAEKMAKSPPIGPKAKYTVDDKSAFEAAVESKREDLFGHRRDAQGKVVS
jgi:hypothetical protein